MVDWLWTRRLELGWDLAMIISAFCWVCPLFPTSFRMDLATNPLQLTSTGHTFTFQPRPSASPAKLSNCVFRSYASSMASSHGTVSLMMLVISGGKTSLWPRSARISQSQGSFLRFPGQSLLSVGKKVDID